MADFLGFAWKVFVIILIIGALVAAVAAGLVIANALSSTATSANGAMLFGYSGNTPITMIKPLLDSFGWNGSGGSFDTLAIWEALAVAIPALFVAVISVRWLIRVLK